MPFFFKNIIDTLNVEIDPTTGQGVFAIAGTVILGCERYRATSHRLLLTLRPQMDSLESALRSSPSSGTPSSPMSRKERSDESLAPSSPICSVSTSAST